MTWERDTIRGVLYRLRLIDSWNLRDSEAGSKQLGCVVMVHQQGHDHDDNAL
jgi:hypothetical protein